MERKWPKMFNEERVNQDEERIGRQLLITEELEQCLDEKVRSNRLLMISDSSMYFQKFKDFNSGIN